MRMGRQKLRKLRSGCALSQKEHLARLDQLSGKGTDQALLGRVLQSPAVKAQFHAFSNMHRRAAVGLAQKTILFQAFGPQSTDTQPHAPESAAFVRLPA